MDSGNASLLWQEATYSSDSKIKVVFPVDWKDKQYGRFPLQVSEEFNKTTTQTTRLVGANEFIQS
jgi:hypothetical protein